MLLRTIEVPYYPQRIVSLCPSITETIAYLGGNLVGITYFCKHPESLYKQLPKVGGTKKVHLERIHKVQPDLIIAEKEENTKEIVEQLSAFYPVYVIDVLQWEDAFEMIYRLGDLLQAQEKAKTLIEAIQAAWTPLKNIAPPLNVAYLIWNQPYMSVGSPTYIGSVLNYLGFKNPYQDRGRYPEVAIEDLKKADVIFLASEPFPFKEKHKEQLRQQGITQPIYFVEGEAFTWYGVRMLPSARYLNELIQQICHDCKV